MQAIFVLIKLYSLHAVEPSDLRTPDIDTREGATRAILNIHKHLLLSYRHVVRPLHTNEVEQASILAVISVQTALSILRTALKSNCFHSLVTVTCACMALQAMLRLRRTPRAAREAASTLIDSGTVSSPDDNSLVYEKFVLTWNCPYSEGPLQSECSDWLAMALSLHQGCPTSSVLTKRVYCIWHVRLRGFHLSCIHLETITWRWVCMLQD